MDNVVIGVQVFFPAADFEKLDHRHLDHWIAELRKGETSVRQLRHRLEALRDGHERTCAHCARPLTGRADAIYCDTRCRVNAHRAAKRRAADEVQ